MSPAATVSPAAMADLLHECNTGELKVDPKTFRDTWCARCHRPECDLAMFARTDPMAHRNATWREKFFGTPQADLSIPKFAQIAKLDFPSLLQKAMRLEISTQRGRSDWSIPEIPVLDGQVVTASPSTTSHVDEAVKRLTHRDSPPEPEPEPDEPEPDEPDEPDEPEEPRLAPKAAPPPRPTQRNTPDPGEVMLGGPNPHAPASSSARPHVPTNSWAPPPKPSVTVVKTGAKIQFGVDGKGKVVDG